MLRGQASGHLDDSQPSSLDTRRYEQALQGAVEAPRQMVRSNALNDIRDEMGFGLMVHEQRAKRLDGIIAPSERQTVRTGRVSIDAPRAPNASMRLAERQASLDAAAQHSPTVTQGHTFHRFHVYTTDLKPTIKLDTLYQEEIDVTKVTPHPGSLRAASARFTCPDALPGHAASSQALSPSASRRRRSVDTPCGSHGQAMQAAQTSPNAVAGDSSPMTSRPQSPCISIDSPVALSGRPSWKGPEARRASFSLQPGQGGGPGPGSPMATRSRIDLSRSASYGKGALSSSTLPELDLSARGLDNDPYEEIFIQPKSGGVQNVLLDSVESLRAFSDSKLMPIPAINTRLPAHLAAPGTAAEVAHARRKSMMDDLKSSGKSSGHLHASDKGFTQGSLLARLAKWGPAGQSAQHEDKW